MRQAADDSIRVVRDVWGTKLRCIRLTLEIKSMFRPSYLPLAALFLAVSQVALAGGFYITELGTPGSLGTAGVANLTNNFGPDSAWTNPAGMTRL